MSSKQTIRTILPTMFTALYDAAERVKNPGYTFKSSIRVSTTSISFVGQCGEDSNRFLWIPNIISIIINRHLIAYPTAININYFWGFGSLAGLVLIIQIITGILLAMHYAPNAELAFASVEHIMRDVNDGWLLRYLHSNGASFFFFVVYIHMGRGIFYRSYVASPFLWHTGILIFVLMMATAFMGYILPWGQMSFWGATVITNIFSAIPYIGGRIVAWLWGGFAVGNPTLNRFFSLHYLLPFIIAGLAFLHLIVLHMRGSNNPLSFKEINKKVSFYPYFVIKDAQGLLLLLLIYLFIVFFYPNLLGHPDNYILAYPLATPAHIVPEWYFLPFYAILRACPSKIGGILSLIFALIGLALLPIIDRPTLFWSAVTISWRIYCNFFYLIVFLLCWLGAQPAEGIYVTLSKITTVLYFILLCLPLNLNRVFNNYRDYSTISHLTTRSSFLGLWSILSSLFAIITVLISVAYFTLAERKVMAAIQRRRGPNVVGFAGLLQPLADGLKAIAKEIIIPRGSTVFIFIFAANFMFILSLYNWIFLPLSFVDLPLNNQFNLECNNNTYQYNYLDFCGISEEQSLNSASIGIISGIQYALYNSDISLLVIFAISSLNVYGVIFAGWASNSKYAFLGALRSAAQMISYEVALGLLVVPVIILTGSLNLAEIVAAQKTMWFCIPLLPLAIMFFISSLAETNRTPFDLPEAEAELVAGYNVEYSSIIFAMFFLGEYSNMLVMSALNTCIFFGGGWACWDCVFQFVSYEIVFAIKIVIFAFFFILVRAILPRYRYDQLMNLGWKVILPFSLTAVISVSVCVRACEYLPSNLCI